MLREQAIGQLNKIFLKAALSMAFNEALADRVRAVFSRQGVDPVEKRMMGGLCLWLLTRCAWAWIAIT